MARRAPSKTRLRGSEKNSRSAAPSSRSSPAAVNGERGRRGHDTTMQFNTKWTRSSPSGRMMSFS